MVEVTRVPKNSEFLSDPHLPTRGRTVTEDDWDKDKTQN